MTKQRPSWRRWVVRGAVCVVLGFVTTVGVAWNEAWKDVFPKKVTRWAWFEARLCVIRDGWIASERKWFAGLPEESDAILIAQIEHDQYWYSQWSKDPPPDVQSLRIDEPLRPRTDISGRSRLDARRELEFGWPLRALWYWKDGKRTAVARGTIGRDAFRRYHMRFPGQTWDGLPVLPLWGGLTANVAMYGVAYSVVLYGPFAIVKWFKERSRRKFGYCPACGYDLTHKFDTGCPECGWNRA